MKDVIVLVATDYEDVELITTIDIFSRENVSYDLVSIENKDMVKGKYNALVETKKIKDIDTNNYRAVYIPGGHSGEAFSKSKETPEILLKYKKENKIIAAICAGPEVAFQAGVLKDVKITSYPGFAQNGHNTGNEVEVSGNVVTGRDYLATPNFAKELVKIIKK